MPRPRRIPPWGSTPIKAACFTLPLEEELKDSYLNYAMSVIVSRALPDVRDGLKPSQRRILVAMNDLNLTPGAGRVKCAKISGDTSGNYHPHGEEVIYPTLVRMAQEWNMRHVLIDKQGNFGSIAGLPPAAMRYTEARMSPIAALDARRSEARHGRFRADLRRLAAASRRCLPSKFPNLLVNGANGIAVGMATSIPPHNLGEICDCLVRVIDQPDVSIDELLEICPGPDFPTGGIIVGRTQLRRAYHTGRGTVTLAGPRGSRSRARAGTGSSSTRCRISRAATRVEKRIGELIYEDRIKDISGGAERKRPQRAGAAGLRAEEGGRPRRRAQPALSVLAAARVVFDHPAGAGGRQAAGAELQGAAAGVHSPPRHGHPPPHAVPALQGPAAQAHGRRVCFWRWPISTR